MRNRTSRAVEFALLADLETDEHVLWPYALKVGYGAVQYDGSVQYTHRLALQRREPIHDGRNFACHRPTLNCPRACMNYRHLYWGSFAQNMADMVTDGRSTKGERHGSHRLTEGDVRTVRAHWSSGLTAAEIAPMFGVTRQCISNIVHGYTWAWLE